MGVLYDIYITSENKKRCTICGCIMDKDHESDICECCQDDRNNDDENTFN